MNWCLIISPNDFPFLPSVYSASNTSNLCHCVYRLWSSNSWCTEIILSPFCLCADCRLLQIIGHSNFNLFCIMSPISHKLRTTTTIYFDIILQSKYANFIQTRVLREFHATIMKRTNFSERDRERAVGTVVSRLMVPIFCNVCSFYYYLDYTSAYVRAFCTYLQSGKKPTSKEQFIQMTMKILFEIRC